jgi:hypothetical protein
MIAAAEFGDQVLSPSTPLILIAGRTVIETHLASETPPSLRPHRQHLLIRGHHAGRGAADDIPARARRRRQPVPPAVPRLPAYLAGRGATVAARRLARARGRGGVLTAVIAVAFVSALALPLADPPFVVPATISFVVLGL